MSLSLPKITLHERPRPTHGPNGVFTLHRACEFVCSRLAPGQFSAPSLKFLIVRLIHNTHRLRSVTRSLPLHIQSPPPRVRTHVHSLTVNRLPYYQIPPRRKRSTTRLYPSYAIREILTIPNRDLPMGPNPSIVKWAVPVYAHINVDGLRVRRS